MPNPPTPARPAHPAASPPVTGAAADSCDWCGSERVEWRKCKLLCLNCGQIVKSCADL